MVRAVDSANRYPEFLPEHFRRLIGEHLGVAEEQIIVGAGATGVVMQVLRALTHPGDRIVMATPTFDGYPIFAQMARLQTRDGAVGPSMATTTSTPWPTPPPTPRSWWCAGRTIRPARWKRRDDVEALPAAGCA